MNMQYNGLGNIPSSVSGSRKQDHYQISIKGLPWVHKDAGVVAAEET